jgi:hypothetical protein
MQSHHVVIAIMPLQKAMQQGGTSCGLAHRMQLPARLPHTNGTADAVGCSTWEANLTLSAPSACSNKELLQQQTIMIAKPCSIHRFAHQGSAVDIICSCMWMQSMDVFAGSKKRLTQAQRAYCNMPSQVSKANK